MPKIPLRFVVDKIVANQHLTPTYTKHTFHTQAPIRTNSLTFTVKLQVQAGLRDGLARLLLRWTAELCTGATVEVPKGHKQIKKIEY